MTKNPYINRANVKKMALQMANEMGKTRFTRVGQDFIDRVEERLLQVVYSEVKAQPSIGKTMRRATTNL